MFIVSVQRTFFCVCYCLETIIEWNPLLLVLEETENYENNLQGRTSEKGFKSQPPTLRTNWDRASVLAAWGLYNTTDTSLVSPEMGLEFTFSGNRNKI